MSILGGVLVFLLALQESWREAQITSIQDKRQRLEDELEIENARSQLTSANTEAVLAKVEFQREKAKLILAKIPRGGSTDGNTARHGKKGAESGKAGS